MDKFRVYDWEEAVREIDAEMVGKLPNLNAILMEISPDRAVPIFLEIYDGWMSRLGFFTLTATTERVLAVQGLPVAKDNPLHQEQIWYYCADSHFSSGKARCEDYVWFDRRGRVADWNGTGILTTRSASPSP